MKKRLLPLLCGATLLSVAALFTSPAQAQPTIFTDPIKDISTNVGTGSGTLDIIRMEVSDSEADVIFNLTVNGNVSSTTWGNFMIGIANMKAAGSTATNGNGWKRPINLIASPTNGMTHWIGSWVNGGGGSQIWTYGTTNWSGPSTISSYTFGVNTNGTSTISYSVSKASLGVTNGDTIFFDAYSSGSGTNDSAVDALSNPNITIDGWSGPYTSDTTNGISSYTLDNTATYETQEITFSVDMNAQIAIGTFDPDAGDAVSVEWGPNPDNDGTYAYLEDINDDGIYTGSAEVSAPLSTPVSYRYVIEPDDLQAPLIRESLNRSFPMPDEPLVLGTVFFNNIAGFRNVTFTVDMSIQEQMGGFDPLTQNMKVVGSFNGWSTGESNIPMDDLGDGIYSKTVLIPGSTGSAITYKFYRTGDGDNGYESIENRTFNLELNEDGAPNPEQELDPVFFNDLEVIPTGRNVTFTIDMTPQVTQGKFTPGNPIAVRGTFNNWGQTALTHVEDSNIYSGTIRVDGTNNSTVEYKFFQPTDDKWEDVGNRSFALILNEDGELNPALELPTDYWNNDSGQTRDVTFTVDMTVQVAQGKFPPTGGVVSVVGSFNGWGDGVDILTNDGSNVFVGTFAITGNEGSTIDYKFHSTNIGAGENAYESISNRTAELGAPDVTQVLPAVYWNNNAGGTTFNTWSGGQQPTSVLVAQYAVGGSTSSTANDGIPSVSSISVDTLTLVAIVRTDDPKLTTVGITTEDLLAEGSWTTEGVSVTDAPDQTGVPTGSTRKVFSVDREGTRQFLGIRATLAP